VSFAARDGTAATSTDSVWLGMGVGGGESAFKGACGCPSKRKKSPLGTAFES